MRRITIDLSTPVPAAVLNMHDRGSIARHRGWIRADRQTRWGNRFVVGRHGTRAEVIEQYLHCLERKINTGEITDEELAAIAGHALGCWCAPQPCHCDILARAAAQAKARIEDALLRA